MFPIRVVCTNSLTTTTSISTPTTTIKAIKALPATSSSIITSVSPLSVRAGYRGTRNRNLSRCVRLLHVRPPLANRLYSIPLKIHSPYVTTTARGRRPVTASIFEHAALLLRRASSAPPSASRIPPILAPSSSWRVGLSPAMTARYRPKAYGRMYSETADDSSDAASTVSSSSGTGSGSGTKTGGEANGPNNNKPKTFSYKISASFSAKFKKWEVANTFNFNPYNRIPYETNWATRKRARPKTGQDAFFVSRISDTGAVAFGVADGVGGYNDSGIDSADFSHTLCEDMADIAYTSPSVLRPVSLIAQGYNRVSHNEHVEGGASTACIGVAKPDGQMEVANLGDSGYIVLRCGRVHYSSAPQTHAFNTPYQLSIIPKILLEQALRFGGVIPFSDRPEDAAIEVHSLQHGDVLIFATDGVWDNLSAQDVLRVCSEEMLKAKGWVMTEAGFAPGVNLAAVADDSGSTSLQSVLARAVASRAKVMSINTKVDGPFAKEVQRVFPGEAYHGGKKDDICVVCVIVLEVSPNYQQMLLHLRSNAAALAPPSSRGSDGTARDDGGLSLLMQRLSITEEERASFMTVDVDMML